MVTLVNNKRDYAIIGRLLCEQQPKLAEQFSAQLTGEEDLTKIPVLFTIFCKIRELKKEEQQGPLFKHDKLNERRLFVACLLTIYKPFTHALSSTIADTIGQGRSNIAEMIASVKHQLIHWEDYRSHVKALSKQMREGV